MSSEAKSLLVFGIYLVLIAITLIIFPNAFLLVFGFPKTNQVWIRVVGTLAFFLAFYNIQAARHELKTFIQWSVYTRGSVIIFFGAFVYFGLARPMLIVFGLIDLISAIWTELALRSTRTAHA